MRLRLALMSLLLLSSSAHLLAQTQTLSEYAKSHPLGTRTKGTLTVGRFPASTATAAPNASDSGDQPADPCNVSKLSDLSTKPPATAKVTDPVPVFTPKTPYPENLRWRRIQGEVHIAAIIACDGTLKDVTVLKASHPELRSLAVDNVSTWRYKPGLVDGQVRPTPVSLIVRFTLR
jgi:TonB family protein